jgi:3-hydroxyisobutyrate dehydrogenase
MAPARDGKVGFIGLGAMGRHMARNLLKAGFPVVVYNRSRPGIDAVVEVGGVAAADPRAVGEQVWLLALCLPNSPEVREVLLGPRGALAGMPADGVVVDMSTIAPRAAQELAAACAERRVQYLDAPVSGGTVGAERGTLTIMVGGDPQAYERAQPVLQAVGKNLYHVGPSGMGQVIKLCNQLVYAAQMVAVAEAYAMGLRAGADPRLIYEILRRSTGNCTALETRAPVKGVVPDSPASNNWAPGFMTDLMLKDLGLALDAGRQSGVPMFVTAAVEQLHRIATNSGHGRQDFSAVALAIDSLAAARAGPAVR